MSAGRTDLKALGVKLSPVSCSSRQTQIDRAALLPAALVFNLPEHCLYFEQNADRCSGGQAYAYENDDLATAMYFKHEADYFAP